MLATLIPIIGNIVLDGMKLWNEKRRTRFKNQYYDILRSLDYARSRPSHDWIDSEIDVLNEKLETFLRAYAEEVKNENIAND